ncbi:hypothetical protein L7F22_038151 [Adiantum nelumboides]|nr:hypothetical protein [Adiantum nelumboides]
MPGTAMSLEALTDQLICTHRRSVQPFICHTSFVPLQGTPYKRAILNVLVLRASQCIAVLTRCWDSHRSLNACRKYANTSFHLVDTRSLPPNLRRGCHAYGAGRLLHHHNILSDLGRQRQETTLEHSDITAFVTLLQQLEIPQDLPRLRLLHRYIIIHAIEGNNNLERLLLYVYSKAGAAMDVLALFLALNEPDLASWNFVIGSCAKHGEKAASFQLFAHMQSQGHLPDHYLYASILSACCLEADLHIGKRLHACITASKFSGDIIVATALVSMYGKCCSLDRANMAFFSIQRQDGVSWNAIITAHMQHGDGRDALQLYEIMHNEGFIPDKVTFTSILSACANVGALTKGAQVHAQFIGTCSKLNLIMVTSLVNMYIKCGRMLAARRLFDGICKEDSIIWNAMISGYAQNGLGNESLKIFEQMTRENVKPTKATFIATLEACMNDRALIEGKQMHMLVKQYGYESDVVVGTALFMMYGKCGDLGSAFTVFDKLMNRTVVSWNALIACCAQGALGWKVLQHFDQMLGEGVIPDTITYVNLLPMCSSHASVVECKRVHSSIVNSKVELDDNVRAGLVNVYGKLGRIEDAKKVIYLCPRSSSVSLWTAFILAWSQIGAYSDALQCFFQMLVEGVLPDKVASVSILTTIASQGSLTKGLQVHAYIAGSDVDVEVDVQNSLLSMYGKCGSMYAACAVFARMITRDAISYRAMIAVLVQFDHFNEAINIFWQMLYEGLEPDNVTFVIILNVCGSSGMLTQGLKLHACSFYMSSVLKLDDLLVGTGLLSMYACCGCLGNALKVFNFLRVKDIFSWISMMEAYAFHGEGQATLSLFEHLQKEMLTPDRNTVTKLLSACSHAGLVNEAGSTFHNLSKFSQSELIIDHFNCIIDLLGRVGQLEEAEEMVKRMPILPNAMSWSSLLTGCRLSGDVHRGEFAALCIMELQPECVATYISLANIYVAAGAKANFCTLDLIEDIG